MSWLVSPLFCCCYFAQYRLTSFSLFQFSDALKAKESNRPYSIVFCGVNGVGKSTTLAKIAAFFMSKGLKVMVAACDTFRSGAIEQLRTHSLALKFTLFDRGYLKEPHAVASVLFSPWFFLLFAFCFTTSSLFQDALALAAKEGYDVVLIDTAGRMQDNTPLMKALAQLIGVNNPDLVLFVGEALVGNDAVDQLTKFNRFSFFLLFSRFAVSFSNVLITPLRSHFCRSLIDFAASSSPRAIDGIVMTKFDTIDDKVCLLWCFHSVFSSHFRSVQSGWCCNFIDLLNWSSNCLCWLWSNLYVFCF
jgi:signal recognition particle receptor subunit alpha